MIKIVQGNKMINLTLYLAWMCILLTNFTANIINLISTAVEHSKIIFLEITQGICIAEFTTQITAHQYYRDLE